VNPGQFQHLPNGDFLEAIKAPEFADAPPQVRRIVGMRLVRMYGGTMSVARQVELLIEHTSWRPSDGRPR
jgi:hypothetical protein